MNRKPSHREGNDDPGPAEELARSVISTYPKIAASPGFDAGVWRRLAARREASPFARLTALLDRPWLKTLASGLGGAVLGLFLMMGLAALAAPNRPGPAPAAAPLAPPPVMASLPGDRSDWSFRNRLAMRAWREQIRDDIDRDHEFGSAPDSDRGTSVDLPIPPPQQPGGAGTQLPDKGTPWKLGAALGSDSPSSRSAGSLC